MAHARNGRPGCGQRRRLHLRPPVAVQPLLPALAHHRPAFRLPRRADLFQAHPVRRRRVGDTHGGRIRQAREDDEVGLAAALPRSRPLGAPGQSNPSRGPHHRASRRAVRPHVALYRRRRPRPRDGRRPGQARQARRRGRPAGGPHRQTPRRRRPRRMARPRIRRPRPHRPVRHRPNPSHTTEGGRILRGRPAEAQRVGSRLSGVRAAGRRSPRSQRFPASRRSAAGRRSARIQREPPGSGARADHRPYQPLGEGRIAASQAGRRRRPHRPAKRAPGLLSPAVERGGLPQLHRRRFLWKSASRLLLRRRPTDRRSAAVLMAAARADHHGPPGGENDRRGDGPLRAHGIGERLRRARPRPRPGCGGFRQLEGRHPRSRRIHRTERSRTE